MVHAAEVVEPPSLHQQLLGAGVLAAAAARQHRQQSGTTVPRLTGGSEVRLNDDDELFIEGA